MVQYRVDVREADLAVADYTELRGGYGGRGRCSTAENNFYLTGVLPDRTTNSFCRVLQIRAIGTICEW